MARMVNADELAAAIRANEIFSAPKNHWKSVFGVPIVDAEVVVRCRECKHGKQMKDGYYTCFWFAVLTEEDWYCCRGERKGGDE